MIDSISGFELSPFQKRLWLFQEHGFTFNNLLEVNVHGQIVQSKLKKHLSRLIENHESLRTCYPKMPNMLFPFQEIMDDAVPNLLYYNFQNDNERTQLHKIATIRDTAFYKKLRPSKQFSNIEAILIKLKKNEHRLLLWLPSMISDTQTLLNVLEEMTIYDKGGTPEEKLQFTQYSEWQNDLRTSPEKEAREFWNSQDFTQNAFCQLVFENVDLNNSNEILFESWNIGHDLFQKITEQSKALNVEPNILLLACWSIVLNQYLNKKDIVIGEVFSERSFEELDPINGLLAKTLPVSIEINGDDTLKMLCQQIMEVRKSVKEWQDNFSWGIEIEDNIQTKTPTFFSLCYEYISTDIIDRKFEIEQFYTCIDPFKLKLSCVQLKGKLKFNFYYQSQFFKPSAIQCIKERLITTMDQVLKDGVITSSIANLNRAEGDELKLLNSFNRTTKKYKAKTLISLFKYQVRKNPDKIAVSFLNKEITYRQLDVLTSQFAAHLQHKYAVVHGTVVAFKLNRSEKTVITMLGILKCGAIYLPIDSHVPLERMKYMLKNSKAITLIVEEQDEVSFDIGIFNFNYEAFLEQNLVFHQINYDIEDVAYLIYTSGSTGMPKGVLTSNLSLCNYINWFNTTYNIDETDSTLLFSSVAFDLCYTGLWTSLTAGATIHIMKESDFFNGEKFVDALVNQKPTYIKLTPSHFNALINSVNYEQGARDFSLRLIVLGGEEINTGDLNRFYSIRDDVVFVNHYGPTETTIGSIACTINRKYWETFRHTPVLGKPIFNTYVYILNDNMQILPPGVTGEICISGHGLSSGYLDNEALTNLKFITSDGIKGQKLYRTGDLGRWTQDGYIQFLGRKDFQIKIRGYRIELPEIEKTLLELNDIEEAAVVADDVKGEKEIVAYYVASTNISEGAITKFLLKHLPNYMLPAQYISLESLPLLRNGKKNYKALSELKKQSPERYFKSPKTRLQHQLVSIWKDVLGIENISIEDDFVKCGGHSLKAVQIVSRIFKELQVKIELKELFEPSSSIEKIAQLITGQEKSKYYNIIPIEDQEYYSVSHAQQRLWIMDQMGEANNVYNIPEAYIFEGKLQKNILEKAFLALLERHESLRTSFIVVDDKPKQSITSAAELDFIIGYIDLRMEDKRNRIAKELADSEAVNSFDITKAPLIRVKLLQLKDESFLFLFTMHHIISDAWSSEIIFEEIVTLYKSYCKGRNEQLEPLHIQYRDYSAWQNKKLRGAENEKHKKYWMEQFQGVIPRLNFPMDFSRPNLKTYNGDIIHSTISVDVSKQIAKLADSENATLYMLLLSIVRVLLYRYTGDQDIVIGCPIAGRNHKDIENQVGFYLNNLAIRTQTNREDTFLELLKKVKTSVLNAYEHEIYPFDLLVKDLDIIRDHSRSPLFDIVVMLRNIEVTDQSRTNLPNINIKGFNVNYNVNTIDLRIVFYERGGNIVLSVDYNTDIFKKSTIEKFIDNFNSITRSILNNPEHKIATYKLDEDVDNTEVNIVARFNF